MVDPDRPMKAEVAPTFQFNLKEHDLLVLAAFFVRATQHLSAALDQSTGGSEWRPRIYQQVFHDTAHNNHEGTGSDSEIEMLKANALFAELLGVKN